MKSYLLSKPHFSSSPHPGGMQSSVENVSPQNFHASRRDAPSSGFVNKIRFCITAIVCLMLLFAIGCNFGEVTTVIGDYKVTFDPRGGNIDGSNNPLEIKLKRGDTIPLPPVNRSGYSFEGWYSDSLNGTLYEDEYVALRNNVTVYAQWTGDFTVTFDPRGGFIKNEDRSMTVERNGTITLPDVNRPGYWFEGWHSAPAGGDLYGGISDEYDVAEDGITMYARWKSILYMDEGDSVINGIVCVFVEAGTFTMGSPESEEGRFFDEVLRVVTLTQNYWISKYPITNRQLGREVAAGEEDYPAVSVTWETADYFARGKGGLLPTEAQWEFAARGGKNEKGYNIYSGSNILKDVAWYSDNSDGRAHKVGQKLPNELGIYDMTGNVKELCNDWYGIPTGEPSTDPAGPPLGPGRIIRGCGFGSEERDCRIADRPYILPTATRSDLGFRVIFPAD